MIDIRQLWYWTEEWHQIDEDITLKEYITKRTNWTSEEYDKWAATGEIPD
jgi:hypothetical protein